ncbi:MAG: protein kinase [Deltaproteobacteria bacterium]|nr:protein kinase [Deltaproteobacteria bacterium]
MGQVISHKYEEIERLGQGGMGVVYKVRHTDLDTIFALKVLPADLLATPELVKRFYREARVMARLNHANIVRVLDIARDESLNIYYFVMEYIQGKTLKQYLKDKGLLPLPEALEIGCQIARALVYAHRQSPPVIHRDIKPENIMIEEPRQRVVVLDFGIAKQLEAECQFTVAGTPRYCAPEQLLGKPITGSVDVYSLGLVMYEMITGTPFFAKLDQKAILTQALDKSRENEPFFEPPLPPALTATITRAIRKSSENRYATMLDFLRDLESCRRTARLENEATPVLPSAAEQEQPWRGQAPVPRASEQEALLFLEGRLNRERFTAEAFRSLIVATAESQSVGDRQIEVFHVLMSLMRGAYLEGFYHYLTGDTGKELEAKLKILRARIRQAYRRPVVEKKLIVRELYRTDGTPAVLALLDAAALLARPRPIAEKHLVTALLREAPAELLSILQDSGLTTANLQRYIRENT